MVNERTAHVQSIWDITNAKCPPGGVLGISSDGDDRMEPIVKTQKNP